MRNKMQFIVISLITLNMLAFQNCAKVPMAQLQNSNSEKIDSSNEKIIVAANQFEKIKIYNRDAIELNSASGSDVEYYILNDGTLHKSVNQNDEKVCMLKQQIFTNIKKVLNQAKVCEVDLTKDNPDLVTCMGYSYPLVSLISSQSQYEISTGYCQAKYVSFCKSDENDLDKLRGAIVDLANHDPMDSCEQ